jgi:hypothetical protein
MKIRSGRGREAEEYIAAVATATWSLVPQAQLSNRFDLFIAITLLRIINNSTVPSFLFRIELKFCCDVKALCALIRNHWVNYYYK